jgi:uncharacterized cupin superfamily protein
MALSIALPSASRPISVPTHVPLGRAVFTHEHRNDWTDTPIEPSWILDGDPRARSIVLARGRDDFAVTTLWDCTEGTFRWRFDWDETVHILEGRVEVTDESGRLHMLEVGSIAFFPAGSEAEWRVVGRLRKLAICRRAFSPVFARTLSRFGRLRSRLGRVRRLLGFV